MRNNQRGQILIMVIGVMVFLLIVTPALVRWLMQDSQSTVKWRKQTSALNVAQAGLDRACWNLGRSTSTWKQVAAGTIPTGFNFDTTYSDVSGGEYRIRYSSGPSSNQVTILVEGRDSQKKERRTLQAVYENQAIPGPLLTSGNMAMAGAFEPHWGPVMAHGNITLSGAAASKYFPRKYSKNTVTGTSTYPRDTNGLTPPNTDNLEWWSGYNVPDLPLLDFTTMRSSAAANGTLNYYNVNTSSTGHTLTGYSGGHFSTCQTPTGGNFASHANHFYDMEHHPKAFNNLIWYWDGDLVITGACWQSPSSNSTPHRTAFYGTLIVRGNLTLWTGDDYAFTSTTVIPPNAWREYQKFDTNASNEYPGDTGYHTNRRNFSFGSETWSGFSSGANSDVGIRGFIYVGGNFTIQTDAGGDFVGALWIVGNATNMNASEFSLVFFDSSLDVPVLNVSLVQQSWQETTPSSTSWP